MEKSDKSLDSWKVINKKREIIYDELMSLIEKKNALLEQKQDIEKEPVSENNKILIDKINTQLDEIKIKETALEKELDENFKQSSETLDEFIGDTNKSLAPFQLLFKIEKMVESMFGLKKAIDDLEKNIPTNLSERYEKLENIRKKFIKKEIFLILLTILYVVLFAAITIVFLRDFLKIGFAIIFVTASIPFAFAIGVNKDFEMLVKKILISKYNEESQILNFITGKRAKIRWDSSYFEYDKEKLQKRYNAETGLNYKDLSIESQIEYENKYFASDSEKLFGTYFSPDDRFEGICEGVKFSLSEGCTTTSSDSSFNGIIIKIFCNVGYKNKLVIKNSRLVSLYVWETLIIKGLKEILKDNKNIAKNLKVYSDNILFANEVLTPNFISFVNKLGKEYTYIFVDGNLFLIKPTVKDIFKMGSLYKSVDNPAQYEKFEKDIQKILEIISEAKNIEYLEKPTEKELDLFGFNK